MYDFTFSIVLNIHSATAFWTGDKGFLKRDIINHFFFIDFSRICICKKCERSGDICIAVNDNYNDCVNQYDVWKWNTAGKLLVSDSDLQQRAVHEQCLFILGQCRACNDYLCIQSGLCGNFRMGTDKNV